MAFCWHLIVLNEIITLGTMAREKGEEKSPINKQTLGQIKKKSINK